MSVSTLTSKGQMTLPKEVRDDLNLKTGDKLEFTKVTGGYMLKPRNVRAADLAGVLHRPGVKLPSQGQIDAAVSDVAAERFERTIDRT